MRRFSWKTKALPLFSVFILLALWQAASWAVNKPLLLPSPTDAFLSLLKLIQTPAFLQAVGATLLRGLLGFAVSILAGTVTGIAGGLNRTVESLLKPLIVTIRSTPVISVILLALIWFSSNAAPVFIGFLVMYPIVYTNVMEGIKSVDPALVEMAKVYRVKPFRILREVYFPAITPFFLGGVSSAVGIGWKAVIASEVLSQPAFAIGTEMQTAQTYLLVPMVIAWTITAILLGYLFEILIESIQKKMVAWK